MAIKAGLDFGTTTSILSYLENQRPKYFSYGGESGEGTPYVPSVIAYGNNLAVIGRHAVDLSRDRYSVYRYFKMLLPEPESTFWPEEYGRYVRESRSPSSVARDYIGELILGKSPERDRHKQSPNGDAFQIKMNQEIDEIIVSVPNVWKDVRAHGRHQLQEVIRSLGLPLKQLISEPVAAAAFFSHKFEIKHAGARRFRGNLLICDMGGGTFDVTLCKVEPGRVEVILNDGNGQKELGLAGVYFDRAIIKAVMKEKGIQDQEVYEELMADLHENKLNPRNYKPLFSRLTDPSPLGSSQIYSLFSHKAGDNFAITYSQILQAFESVRRGIEGVLDKIKKNAEDQEYKIDKIVLVGGFAKFPLVQDAIARAFGEDLNTPSLVDIATLTTEEMAFAISYGACLIANGLVQVSEKYEHSIGIIVNNRSSENIKRELIKAGEPLDSISTVNFYKGEKGTERQFMITKNSPTAHIYFHSFNDPSKQIIRTVTFDNIPNSGSEKTFSIGARVDLSKVPYVIIKDPASGECREYALDVLSEIWEVD